MAKIKLLIDTDILIDYIIAATAWSKKMPLLTRNKRHVSRIQEITLGPEYEKEWHGTLPWKPGVFHFLISFAFTLEPIEASTVLTVLSILFPACLAFLAFRACVGWTRRTK